MNNLSLRWKEDVDHTIMAVVTAKATTGATLVVITVIMAAMSAECQITYHTIEGVDLMALTHTVVTVTVTSGATTVDSLKFFNFLA